MDLEQQSFIHLGACTVQFLDFMLGGRDPFTFVASDAWTGSCVNFMLGVPTHFGMKAHIGVDAESGLVHTVIGTAANVNDVTQGHGLLHGEETVVFADAGYQGAGKRPEATGVDWHVAMRPGKRKRQKHTPWGALSEQAEKLKASVRAKVEHPFRVIKRQFGHTKVRYRGLKKNTAQLITLFALSNIWMARRTLLQRAQA